MTPVAGFDMVAGILFWHENAKVAIILIVILEAWGVKLVCVHSFAVQLSTSNSKRAAPSSISITTSDKSTVDNKEHNPTSVSDYDS